MRSIFTYFLFLMVCFFATHTIKAQTLFEDVKGQTSIVLPIGGITRINTTANSLKLGYYYNRSDKNVVFGVDASGISNNGFAPLVSQKELSPEANINFNVGFKNITAEDVSPSKYDYLNIRVGVGASKYKLLDPSQSYEQQLSSEAFNKINLGVSYNYFLNGNMIFGAYAGYDRTNNISTLKELTIRETTAVGTGTGGTVRTAESEYTAWEGELKAINQFSLFFDYVYIPDLLSNRMALSIYSRSNFNSIRSMTNGGVGLYLNRIGQPLKIIGGLVYEFEDLFGGRNASIPLGERGTLGIVLGYNF